MLKVVDKDKLVELKQRIDASEFIEDNVLQAVEKGLPSHLIADWQAVLGNLDSFEFECAGQKLEKMISLM
jgi:hypothetical protein